ncbi:MAG: 2-oxoacid:acceptor oxidoreductase family protein [Candidatus Woesearchaeota archaeon]|nr:2-oxoacid:acceptor oxidoreductase family protein [Candidatus Woesearchaeota archaeon]
MIEIRIHSRAGQGAKSAAQFIAEAAMEKGKFVQAFPEYGAERMGAPMKVYVRISDKKIRNYSSIVAPDVVMVIDPYFIEQIDVAEGLKESGILIVNTNKDPAEVKKITNFNGKIFALDATKIAFETIKANKPNTPLLGALIKATNVVDLEEINKKIKDYFLKKLGEEKTNANINAVARGFNETKS